MACSADFGGTGVSAGVEVGVGDVLNRGLDAVLLVY